MDQEMARHDAMDGRADFDFEIGRWHVHSRRLREVLKGATEWVEFDGISVARKLLGGLGMIDEITNELASGPVQGMTVRLFDPQAREWSVHFAEGIHGVLTPPLIGRFEEGRGVFYAHEVIEGKHIFSRYIWQDITPSTYKWEQAFSVDGGNTWETNWIQDHVRLPE